MSPDSGTGSTIPRRESAGSTDEVHHGVRLRRSRLGELDILPIDAVRGAEIQRPPTPPEEKEVETVETVETVATATSAAAAKDDERASTEIYSYASATGVSEDREEEEEDEDESENNDWYVRPEDREDYEKRMKEGEEKEKEGMERERKEKDEWYVRPEDREAYEKKKETEQVTDDDNTNTMAMPTPDPMETAHAGEKPKEEGWFTRLEDRAQKKR
jgi:hypothetical protein